MASTEREGQVMEYLAQARMAEAWSTCRHCGQTIQLLNGWWKGDDNANGHEPEELDE